MTSEDARLLLTQRELDEADYRLLVDVDQAAWEAERAEMATFAAASDDYLSSAWPGLTLRMDATSL